MLFCETCDRPAKAACRSGGHEIKRRYRSNKNLRKRCACSPGSWATCSHPWHFNYKGERGGLGVSAYDEAKRKFSTIVAEIDNGKYVRPTEKPEPKPIVDRPTFAVVAKDYAEKWIDRELGDRAREAHDYAIAFLAGVTVPPGVPFTDKPFHLIIRADITQAIEAKRTPTLKTYQKGEKTWTRTVGGDVAANRLRDYLSGLWNWAVEAGYADATPFVRIGGGRSPFQKAKEQHRERRLRDGEEAGLLEHASPHLRDCIVAALETGMRKDEILSLQWKEVRWLQNELHLSAEKTKTKKSRQIPLTPTLRDVLKRRLHGTTDGPDGPTTFTFKDHHYVFGDEAGGRVNDVKTAWETAVLKAHGLKPERTKGRGLSAECRAKLAEIDLHFHDLRHEAGSRRLEAGWPLHAVSRWLGHSKITTTSTYLNADANLLHELTERAPLTLVKR